MLHKALTQFLEDVEWVSSTSLLDLPPGAGLTSMTLAQPCAGKSCVTPATAKARRA